MHGFLVQLEAQKKREIQSIREANVPSHQLQWQILQWMEEKAERLCRTMEKHLPNDAQIERAEVRMENYHRPVQRQKFKIKAQVSDFNRKEFTIKVHCHQFDQKDRHQKLALVEYRFRHGAK